MCILNFQNVDEAMMMEYIKLIYNNSVAKFKENDDFDVL
jgi:hypothetical protein